MILGFGRPASAAAFAMVGFDELGDGARPSEVRQCAVGKFAGDLQRLWPHRGHVYRDRCAPGDAHRPAGAWR